MLNFPLTHGLAAAALALAGCTTVAQTPASPPPKPKAEAQAENKPEAQLAALIGDAACTSDQQCRTLGWGAKACGGPERWVAWSTARTDGAALERLAKRHADAQRVAQERSGMMSNCMYVADPGARCVAQRCTLQDGTGGAAAAAR